MAELRQKAAVGPGKQDPAADETEKDAEKGDMAAAERQSSQSSSATSDAPTETNEPRFEPIRPAASERKRSMSLSLARTRSVAEAAEYEANPYDIDRVYTNASVRGIEKTKSKTQG